MSVYFDRPTSPTNLEGVQAVVRANPIGLHKYISSPNPDASSRLTFKNVAITLGIGLLAAAAGAGLAALVVFNLPFVAIGLAAGICITSAIVSGCLAHRNNQANKAIQQKAQEQIEHQNQKLNILEDPLLPSDEDRVEVVATTSPDDTSVNAETQKVATDSSEPKDTLKLFDEYFEQYNLSSPQPVASAKPKAVAPRKRKKQERVEISKLHGDTEAIIKNIEVSVKEIGNVLKRKRAGATIEEEEIPECKENFSEIINQVESLLDKRPGRGDQDLKINDSYRAVLIKLNAKADEEKLPCRADLIFLLQVLGTIKSRKDRR